MTNQTEKIELIRRAHEILDRISAALRLPWFAEEEPAYKDGEQLDAAIDAALAGSQGEKP